VRLPVLLCKEAAGVRQQHSCYCQSLEQLGDFPGHWSEQGSAHSSRHGLPAAGSMVGGVNQQPYYCQPIGYYRSAWRPPSLDGHWME
jgi:hypothetical protein